MNGMDIAKTILSQLKQTTPSYVMMSWGASAFSAIHPNQIRGIGEEYLGGLMFYVRGYKHTGHVIVTLAGNDTYTVTIGHVKKATIKPKKQLRDVYVFDLGNIIDELVEKQDEYVR